jgi:hypothetical protein
MEKAILKRDELYKLYGNDAQVVKEILTEYLSGFDKMMSDIAAAAASGPTELSKSIHCYAAGFMYIGFPDLQASCSALERQCQENISDGDIKTKFELLYYQIASTKEIVIKEINTLESITTF